jgi:hypothetical protein
VNAVSAASRASFVGSLAEEAASGNRALLLAPLGAGKTHSLLAARDVLAAKGVPFVFLDLFTAASTPERLLSAIGEAVGPFMGEKQDAMTALLTEGASDRHRSSGALLQLFDLLAAPTPFVWLVDEVTEIRSLAYFPGLGRIESPFARALSSARGAILASSYLGLAEDLFPDLARVVLPGLTVLDLDDEASRGLESDVLTALTLTAGTAANLLPLLADLRESRDLRRSLIRLLRPGGALELGCRRRYEVLLMRSRGYAVSKRAAEVVAGARDQRLTDLFPRIGRTPGASRQYLRWLVEVGLLTQTRKRYDFADSMVGLWAELYLGRSGHPTDEEIGATVSLRLARPSGGEAEEPEPPPARRPDRFEEID